MCSPLFGGWGCDLYEACISPGMRANPSTCGVLTSVGTLWSVSGWWWCTFGRTAWRATRPEWIYFQEFLFRAQGGWGEGRIFRIYNNRQLNKQTKESNQGGKFFTGTANRNRTQPDQTATEPVPHCSRNTFLIDWCCFYYFLRNSLVALLEALFARNTTGTKRQPIVAGDHTWSSIWIPINNISSHPSSLVLGVGHWHHLYTKSYSAVGITNLVLIEGPKGFSVIHPSP